MGIQQQVDSLFLWAENGPQFNNPTSSTAAYALIMATATNAQTIVGADQVNTKHAGAAFWINVIGSVRATCSVNVKIQMKNPFIASTYVTITSLSLASIDSTNDGSAFSQSIWVYPGISATLGVTNIWSNPLPRDYRVIATIQTQATSTTGIVRFEVGKAMLL